MNETLVQAIGAVIIVGGAVLVGIWVSKPTFTEAQADRACESEPPVTSYVYTVHWLDLIPSEESFTVTNKISGGMSHSIYVSERDDGAITSESIYDGAGTSYGRTLPSDKWDKTVR